MPRSPTSPKKAADKTKEPHRKTDPAAPSPITDAAAQGQIIDPRSLRLSLQMPGALKAHAVAGAPVSPSNPNPAGAAPKGPVAFGVNIAKPAGNETGAGGHHSQSGGKDSGGSGDTPDQSASLATPVLKDTTQAVIATAAPAGNAALQATPIAAYTPVHPSNTPTPVSAPAAVAPVIDPPATPAIRPNSIDIQVPGAAGDQVDVRVSQRAGNVEVTVRTPDNQLAESLRQHLPELSDRLSETGAAGQVWQPTAAETSTGFGTKQDDPGSNWQGQQQQHGQQQPQTDPDAEQKQGSRKWVDDFYNEQEAR